jgi:uncharacterized protein (TIGR03435 family)
MKGGFTIMSIGITGAAIAALIAGVAFGQIESTLKFEAADIHTSPAVAPNNNGNQFMRGGFYRGGRYEVRTATMVDLVRTAYNVDADKVTGGPAWMDKDQFDVIAKAPADSTPEKLRAMLRNLLAERFSLVVHDDTKPLAVYALTTGKKVLMKQADGSEETGCKLAPQPDPPAGSPMIGMISMNGVVIRLGAGSLITYSCHNISMAAFAEQMRGMIFVPGYLNGNRVVDQTELKGAWDFDVKYSFNFRGPAPVEGAPEIVTIFTAVEKQLGLKLDLTKIPMPVIAVDSVNEKPTDNLPGVSAKMPAPPTEFEVADIKPSDPNPPQGPFNGGGCFFCPGGRVNITRNTIGDLIGLAWNLNGPGSNSRITGIPKSMEKINWDIIAKASTMSPLNTPIAINGQTPQPQVDFDSMRIMLQALLKDRFKLAIHEETKPLPGYALVAVKPKLKPADPTNRAGCKEGPGADGKDPRTTNPAASRLVTCLNMSMADFAAQIPNRAGGYFMELPGGVVDATKLEGNYDITLNFSVAGAVNGGGRGGGAPAAPGEASDPGGGITLQEAIEKQLGLKLEPQKNPGLVLVVDHVEEKPTEN